MESSIAVPVHEQATGSSTLADLIGLAAARARRRAAIRHKRDGAWQDVSYAELGEIVSEIGRGLIDMGIEPGDRVAILCATRPEWTYADFGIAATGAVVVPIYPTNSPEECEWVAGNSGARAIVCEDAAQVAKIERVRGEPPRARDGDRRSTRRAWTTATSRSTPLRERGRGARRGRARRARRRGHARPAVHDHLHLGHHRAAEGLRPDPRQLPRRRLDVRARRDRAGRRRRLPVPPARALVRAADPARGARHGRHARLLSAATRRRSSSSSPRSRPTYLPSVPRIFEKLYTLVTAHGDPDQIRAATQVGLKVRALQAAGEPVPPELQAHFDGGRGGAVQERPRGVRRAAAPGDVRRGADRAPRSSSSSSPAACRCSRATG